jgi:hypothetical protein
MVILLASSMGSISSVILATVLSRGDLRVPIVAEVTTVITLLVISLLQDPLIFEVLIVSEIVIGTIVKHRIVIYVLCKYWPSPFSE